MKFNTLSKKILFIFFILFITLKTNAQQNENGNLSGIIVDESGIPLPGGEIYVKIDNLYFGDISDFDGKFIISKIPAGNQNLHIKYLGYKEKTIPITVIKTITTTYLGKIELQPDVERTEEIVVIARSKGKVRSLNIQKSADNIVNVISLEQASKFPDANIGWASGDNGIILKTTDGGHSWSLQAGGLFSAVDLDNIFFMDANNGWAVGELGTIISTTDGGNTWNDQTITDLKTAEIDLKRITFLNNMNGWLTGEKLTIYKTTNGGKTWSPVAISGTYLDDLNDITIVNDFLIIAAGDGGGIVRSVDGGVSFNASVSSFTTENFDGIGSSPDGTKVIAVSDLGTILK